MNKSDTNAQVMNDVLQSDHHVQMSAEEIAKARAHHDKRHIANPQKMSTKSGAKMKGAPAKPR
jgi:uncharacterized protein YdbL (DUF1318 family)